MRWRPSALFSFPNRLNADFSCRKTEHPGYVETPGRRRTRARPSNAHDLASDTSDAHDSSPGPAEDTIEIVDPLKSTRRTPGRPKKRSHLANGVVNGTLNGSTTKKKLSDGWVEGTDPKVDYSGHLEFGGSLGVSVVMVGFPLLMYYMWIGATYYNGYLPKPAPGESYVAFAKQMGNLVYTGAFPSLKAWTIYWAFFIFEATCYMLLPGVVTYGKPLPHEGGKQLKYYCSAVWSFYVTIVVAVVLHVTGLFKLYTIIDEFGPLMSVAIISGVVVSTIAYFSAIYRGAQHRMTGHPIYDFFMGAELNPRLFGILDFKMFFEVRIPWYMLFLISCGAAARQYEQLGYVSGEVGFLLMAHFLYANACSKGEELIVPTWYDQLPTLSASFADICEGCVLRKMGLYANILEHGWSTSQLLPLYHLSRQPCPFSVSLEHNRVDGPLRFVSGLLLGLGYHE